MKYLLLICMAENAALDDAAAARMGTDTTRWVDEMGAGQRNVLLQGHRLRPTSSATSVRVRAGQVLATDGPFAETKEQICGFDIIECDNLDEAIDVAARHPVAHVAIVEVRPFWEP